jgi:hypothetical protein
MTSEFIERFKATPSATRSVFLAEMAINKPELRDLRIVLEDLHRTLNQIEGETDE